MRSLLVASALLFCCGCTDAQWGHVTSLGSSHRIEMYSGGRKVREWVSTGKPSSETHSDGWCFVDSRSGEMIRVSGHVVITQLGK